MTNRTVKEAEDSTPKPFLLTRTTNVGIYFVSTNQNSEASLVQTTAVWYKMQMNF